MRQGSYKSNAKTTCRTRRPALPNIVIPAKAGIQRGVARGVSSPFASPTPRRTGDSRTVRPEPVEGPPSRIISAAARNPRPHRGAPPDTSSLPQRRRPRYHPRMEAQTNDAYQPIDVSAHIEVFVARSFRATGNARLARQVRGLFRQKKWICSCDVSRPLRNHYKTIAIAATEQRAFFARSSRATGNARLARQVRGLFRQKKWFCSCDRSRPLRNHYKTIATAATEQRAFFDGAMGAPGPTRGEGRPPTPPRWSPRVSQRCARRPRRPSCPRPTGNSSATARPASPRRRTARGWAGPSCG